MRRALRYIAIWCGATAVAVSVSWFGVRGVLRDEFVDDVRVEPFLAQTVAGDHRAPMVTPTPRRTTREPGPVKVIEVKGGEVAFRLDANGCRLVSASPRAGYTAKVSRNDGWIRVDLAKDGHGSGVWCIGHERRTDTWEY
ncbi:hypothetical protein [Nonomuraea sediminis]|uniref:hypothetical protein n=1 Tax=Nonomuraea sediminis TaxID=2835864 RepID=UPI001BDC4528|nr:hypothetical protein [Nonomuraea sediminis]